jgi:hypothetical protein
MLKIPLLTPELKKESSKFDLAQLSLEVKEKSLKKLKENAVICHSRGLIEGLPGNLKCKFYSAFQKENPGYNVFVQMCSYSFCY